MTYEYASNTSYFMTYGMCPLPYFFSSHAAAYKNLAKGTRVLGHEMTRNLELLQK